MEPDPAVGLRLAVALAPWWWLRGRLAGEYSLLREAAGRAVPGSEAWCAPQFWLGNAALNSADLPIALGHFTAVCDAIAHRPPCRVLADCLGVKSGTFRSWARWPKPSRTAAVARRDVGDLANLADLLMRIADLDLQAGRTDDAAGHLRESLQITADRRGL